MVLLWIAVWFWLTWKSLSAMSTRAGGISAACGRPSMPVPAADPTPRAPRTYSARLSGQEKFVSYRDWLLKELKNSTS